MECDVWIDENSRWSDWVGLTGRCQTGVELDNTVGYVNNPFRELRKRKSFETASCWNSLAGEFRMRVYCSCTEKAAVERQGIQVGTKYDWLLNRNKLARIFHMV
jgi:hypothetical protein